MALNPFLQQIIRSQGTATGPDGVFPNTKDTPGIETPTGLQSHDMKQTDALFSKPDMSKYLDRELTPKDLSELDDNMRMLEGAMDSLGELNVSPDPKTMKFGQKVAYKMKMALQPGTKAGRARANRQLQVAALDKLTGDWLQYAELKMKANALSPFEEEKAKALGKAYGENIKSEMELNFKLRIAEAVGASPEDTERMLRADIGMPDPEDPLKKVKAQADIMKTLEGMFEHLDPDELEDLGLGEYKDFVVSGQERMAAERAEAKANETSEQADKDKIPVEQAWPKAIKLANDYMNISKMGNFQKFDTERTDSFGMASTGEALREVPTVEFEDALAWAIKKLTISNPHLADMFAESGYGPSSTPEPAASHDVIKLDDVRARIKELQGG